MKFVWCILFIVTWSLFKSKIIKQRSNILKIDSIVTAKINNTFTKKKNF